jgi:hypothetical protein
MQTLISSLDAPNRRVLEEAAERERARLPLFPACFREEAAESELSSRKYGQSCSMHYPNFCFYFGSLADCMELAEDDTSGVSDETVRWTADEKRDFIY